MFGVKSSKLSSRIDGRDAFFLLSGDSNFLNDAFKLLVFLYLEVTFVKPIISVKIVT